MANIAVGGVGLLRIRLRPCQLAITQAFTSSVRHDRMSTCDVQCFIKTPVQIILLRAPLFVSLSQWHTHI